MWAELLLFLVVIGLAVQQLYSVKKAQQKTREEEAAKQKRGSNDGPVS